MPSGQPRASCARKHRRRCLSVSRLGRSAARRRTRKYELAYAFPCDPGGPKLHECQRAGSQPRAGQSRCNAVGMVGGRSHSVVGVMGSVPTSRAVSPRHPMFATAPADCGILAPADVSELTNHAKIVAICLCIHDVAQSSFRKLGGVYDAEYCPLAGGRPHVAWTQPNLCRR